MAGVRSWPTPNTAEPARVEVRNAVGLPCDAAPHPAAPIPAAPRNAITVNDCFAPGKLGVAVTSVSTSFCKARALHIAVVPRPALLRPARLQLNPAPLTSTAALSAATNATSNVLGSEVLIFGAVTVPRPSAMQKPVLGLSATSGPTEPSGATPYGPYWAIG